jgi:hypothetical protein
VYTKAKGDAMAVPRERNCDEEANKKRRKGTWRKFGFDLAPPGF